MDKTKAIHDAPKGATHILKLGDTLAYAYYDGYHYNDQPPIDLCDWQRGTEVCNMACFHVGKGGWEIYLEL